MEEHYIIDRIEKDYAICEQPGSQTMLPIPLSQLPVGIKEGTYLVLLDGAFQIDTQAEEIARQRIKEKLSRLFQQGDSHS